MSKTNQNDNEADISSDIGEERESISTPISEGYTCSICGKSGFRTQNSLKMHMLRAHRATEGGPTPTLESAIPDALESLSALLRLFIGPREAQAIITFLSPYGPDNVPKLWEALSNVNVPLNRRRMIIESWCVSRSLPIPDIIRSMFNLEPYSSPSFPFGPPKEPQKREDLTFFDYLLKWESLKRESQPQMVAQSNNEATMNEINRLREEMQSLQATHSKQVEALKEEMRKKEMEALQNEIKNLEAEIRRVESSSRPIEGYKADEFRLIADSLDKISKKEPLKTFLEKLPEISTTLSGIVPQEKTQPLPQARVGLIELLRQKGLTVPQ